MAKAKQETAVAKAESTALRKVEELPDWLKESTGQGTQGMTREDVRIPRLKLAQDLTPQIKDEAIRIEGLVPGLAFNDLTKEIYGKGPFTVIIVRRDRPRWVEFDPDDRKVVLDRDVPVGDPRTQWTTNRENGKRVKPKATKFYDYILLLGESHEAVAFSLSSSGIAAAQMLNSYIGLVPPGRKDPLDVFAKRYEFSIVPMKGPKGYWHGWSVRDLGYVTKEEYVLGQAAFDRYKDEEVAFDRGAEEEREPGSDDDEM